MDFIESVELINYRSCKKTVFKPNENLSALIGINGSGKSNLLNGILLLKKIAQAPRHTRSDEFTQSCKLKLGLRIKNKPVRYEAVVNFATNERNIDEVVNADQKWNIGELTGENKWVRLPLIVVDFFKTYTGGSGGVRKGLRDVDLLKLTKLQFDATNETTFQLQTLLPIVDDVYSLAAGISYYSASQFTDPSRCPTSFEIEEGRLSRRSYRGLADHTQFIYDLYQASKQNNREFQEFMSLVGGDGIGLIDNLVFDEIDVPSNTIQVITGGKVIKREIKRLIVVPNFTIRGINLSPNQLSEGTFKTLAMVFYLVTDKSQMLLLEEPEVCIHHGLLANLVEIIKQISREKQIVISTHSDFVLDALDPPNVFLVKNDMSKGTIVRHVPRSMSAREYKALKEYLATTGNLGEYWRHGELER